MRCPGDGRAYLQGSEISPPRGHNSAILAWDIDPFLEDLARGADRMFYFEDWPRDTPRPTAKRLLKKRVVLICWENSNNMR